jgi:ribosomal protein L29
MKEFSNKTKIELQTLLSEKRQGLRKFRFDMTGGKAKNVKEGRTLRREIATIMTFLNSLSKDNN